MFEIYFLYCRNLPVLLKWSSKSSQLLKAEPVVTISICMTKGRLHTHTRANKSPFWCKSNLPWECLTPSCHHRQKGGKWLCVFIYPYLQGEPLIWTECFSGSQVCLHSSGDKIGGLMAATTKGGSLAFSGKQSRPITAISHRLMCLSVSWQWQLQVILTDGQTGNRGLGEGQWFDSEHAFKAATTN